LAEAKEGNRAVFFVDAAHFVLAPFIGFLWSLTRIFIQAPAGRQRFNVLGAINAITQELVTVTNDTYITAESVCALLDKLHNLKLGIPLTLFLDNARYQHCAPVIEKAASLQIELCFLPSYSPNLNLIERFWRFAKEKLVKNSYCPKYKVFRANVFSFLNHVDQYVDELRTLMVENFQIVIVPQA